MHFEWDRGYASNYIIAFKLLSCCFVWLIWSFTPLELGILLEWAIWILIFHSYGQQYFYSLVYVTSKYREGFSYQFPPTVTWESSMLIHCYGGQIRWGIFRGRDRLSSPSSQYVPALHDLMLCRRIRKGIITLAIGALCSNGFIELYFVSLDLGLLKSFYIKVCDYTKNN